MFLKRCHLSQIFHSVVNFIGKCQLDDNPGIIYYTTTCFHLQVIFFYESIDYPQFILCIYQINHPQAVNYAL